LPFAASMSLKILVRVPGPDSNPIPFHCDDRAPSDLIPVEFYYAQASWGLLSGGKIHESNDSGMGYPANDCQFSEILIKGYQYSFFPMSPLQYFIVTWILMPLSGPYNIVSCRL